MVTNDDGVSARGIEALARTASQFGDVIVVAPDSPQSAKSSALTVNAPLYITPHHPCGQAKVYSVNGTPVDCVKLGMYALFSSRRPDLILSGINHGSNAAVNNIYSGTMGAVMEGCILGIPSVGFSLLDHNPEACLDPVLPMVSEVVGRVLSSGLPQGVCLNVNFPAGCLPEGLKVVRAAAGRWTEEYATMSTPSGKPFYWLTGRFQNDEPDNPDTDEYWLSRRCATVVPVRPDQTAADAIDEIKRLFV